MINTQKDDPSMIKVLPINWDEEPVESLSTINYNFEELEKAICDLEFSAANYWDSVYSTYSANSGRWNSAYNTVRDNSANWQNTFTTVRETSGAWHGPISVIYPFPLASIDLPAITEWLNQNYPPISEGAVNYIEGQPFLLFIIGWTVSAEVKNHTCKRVKTSYSAEIRRISCVRYAHVGGGILSYAPACREAVTCKGSNNKVRVEDRHENRIYGFKFVVNKGVWVYKENLY